MKLGRFLSLSINQAGTVSSRGSSVANGDRKTFSPCIVNTAKAVLPFIHLHLFLFAVRLHLCPTMYTRYFDTPRLLVSHRLIILRSRFSFRTIDVSIEIIFFCAVSAKLRCKFQVRVGRNVSLSFVYFPSLYVPHFLYVCRLIRSSGFQATSGTILSHDTIGMYSHFGRDAPLSTRRDRVRAARFYRGSILRYRSIKRDS